MKLRYLAVILIALGLIVSIPMMTLAQNGSPAPNQPQQPARQAPPQLKGGVATVVGVDQPDNCLRVRSGPGSSYDVIGCIAMGTQVNITGVWTSNNWAQLTGDGWVYGPQIATDLRPPQATLSQSAGYAEEYYPIEDYAVDWGYLPDYGYSSYWYSGIPIIVYNSGVWWRYHPWRWWHKRHLNDPYRHWVWNRATGINRNLVTNHPNLNRTFRTNRGNLNRNFVTNRANVNRNLTTNRANFNRALRSNQLNLNRNFTTNQSNLNRNFVRNQSNLNRTFRTYRSNNANFNLNRSYVGSLNRANTVRSFSIPHSTNMRSFSVRSPSVHMNSVPHISGGSMNFSRGVGRHR